MTSNLRITRAWAMPNRWTFQIKPIAELISEYVGEGYGWADPFAGQSSPAEMRNDINPESNAEYHLDALDYAKIMPDVFGVLFDPPYSPRQLKECYESIGRCFTMRDGQIASRWTEVKDLIAPKVQIDGFVISFGWNSNGFGMKRGFEIEEILLVAHGSGHNDTIVTVERKLATTGILI